MAYPANDKRVVPTETGSHMRMMIRVVAACGVLARRVVILKAAPWFEGARLPGGARVSVGAPRLSGVPAEAAPTPPRFSMKPPHGGPMDLPSRTDSRGRIHIELTLATEGVHEIFSDGESVFIFRFGDRG